METKRAHIYKDNFAIIDIDYDCYIINSVSCNYVFMLNGNTTALVPFNYLIIF